MTDLTALDLAHAAMEEAPEDDGARLRFYERLADSELFLALEAEPTGDTISPCSFEVDEGRFVLVFDREERLADFAEGIAPYAALSGRAVVAMIAGQNYGMAVNPGVAPSAILIHADAVDWLAQTLRHAPEETEARPEEFLAPTGLPEALLRALDTKLALAGELARMAYLVGVIYEGGRRGHLLAFIAAQDGAEGALARAAGEALTFSGIEAGTMDVGFFAASDPVAAKLSRVGLRFDLPQAVSERPQRPAPGSDPEKPPLLR